MTTSAARSHDAMEAAERLRESLRRNEAARAKIEQQLAEAEKQINLDLLLADLSSLLREANDRNWSSGQRARLAGLRKRLSDMRAA
jgi:hypothetical protein